MRHRRAASERTEAPSSRDEMQRPESPRVNRLSGPEAVYSPARDGPAFFRGDAEGRSLRESREARRRLGATRASFWLECDLRQRRGGIDGGGRSSSTFPRVGPSQPGSLRAASQPAGDSARTSAAAAALGSGRRPTPGPRHRQRDSSPTARAVALAQAAKAATFPRARAAKAAAAAAAAPTAAAAHGSGSGRSCREASGSGRSSREAPVLDVPECEVFVPGPRGRGVRRILLQEM